MKINIGVTDRIIRALIALMFIALITNQMVTGFNLVLISIITCVLALTSAIGNCPLYTILGFNTIIQKEK